MSFTDINHFSISLSFISYWNITGMQFTPVYAVYARAPIYLPSLPILLSLPISFSPFLLPFPSPYSPLHSPISLLPSPFSP